MRFVYGAHDVTLRDPDFGNMEENSFNNIIRRVRSGELVSFRPANRETRVVLNCTTMTNTKTIVDAFDALLVAAQGDEIALTYLGASYDVIINQNSLSVVANRDTCSYTIAFTITVIP